ncbi:pyridoxamine 5'-phosphate oxidase [Azospirillum fermentarium]|uniref:pyridoxamine 5'-phosphate oxidase n=1 Tax=Azospirillum fermentarium TaxID=1233114 RepID=UPI0022276B46|nr:pyridoxamine 5'-phosphate oxidase [Azospirillum fermentarium]MCW2247146.1 pyridoxamine 5'-phosphate oxidase [Azospirillum fermentarium]
MSDLTERDPFDTFADWMAEAERSEPNDPNAMALATADAHGVPSVRMVLLKGVDPRGFVFYTNTESRKGEQLLANTNAALCFHWKTLKRQIRVEGAVETVTDAEADAYFDSRPRDSRIGAWASQQSRPMEGRWELEKRVAQFAAKFAIGHVPRPPHWTGFRIVPRRIEFWQDRPFRLHERILFTREVMAGQPPGGWTTDRLFP